MSQYRLSAPVPPGERAAPALPREEPIPAPGPFEIERSRLDPTLDRLADGVTRALCVWAAAGSGTTTVLAGWARTLRGRGERVAWFAGGRIRDQVLSGAFWPAVDDVGPRIVVIDDAHQIDEPHGGTALADLVAAAPPGVRLLLGGRHRPGRGFARLQAAGQLVELDGAGLAFSHDEVRRLSALCRVRIPDAAADALVRSTGGWAAGVALAVHRLLSSPDPAGECDRIDGDHPALAGYLAGEVLAGLERHGLDVLRSAAVCEVVPTDLAVAVTGRRDAGRVLESLAGRCAFIGVDAAGGFRFHPVLLTHLLADSARHDPAGTARRHGVAARYFADRGDGPRALDQATAAGDPAGIEALVDRFGLELVLIGEVPRVSRALAAVDPQGTSVPSAALRLLADAPWFPDELRARHLLAAANSGRGASPTWRVILLALTAFHAGDPADTARLLAQLESARSHGPRRDDFATDLVAATAEGWCRSRLGGHAAAEEQLRHVAEAARAAGYDWLFLIANDLAATEAARNGHWMRAAALEDQLPIPRTGSGDRVRSLAGLRALIRRFERGDPVDRIALESMIATEPLGADAGLAVPARAMLLLSALDTHPANRPALDRLARLLREDGRDHPRTVAVCLLPVFGHTLRLDGPAATRDLVVIAADVLGPRSLEAILVRFLTHPPAADAHALEAAITTAGCWRGATIVSAWLALAQSAEATGRSAEADARLERALRLADEIGAERAFLGAPANGAALLEPRLGRLGEYEDLGHRIVRLAADVQPPTPSRSAGIAPLTERERDLLRELPIHQSIAQIARRQNISPNTVKTHLRSIYQKLAAADRAEAVAHAHEQGLL